MRVRLDLSYDGTEFSGWAAQPGRRTVQGELEAALTRVLRLPSVSTTVAGRTDAGVHARGQVANLDVPQDTWAAVPGRSDSPPEVALVRRLAGVLPRDVVVRDATVVPEAFDARFGALWRRYSYRITDAPPDPLRRLDTVTWGRPLDVDAMADAAGRLTGLHDFAAFCKQRDGRTSVRTLLDYSWARDETGVLVATVRADAFCHSMVRFLVGAVVPVGEGRRAPDWPASVLAGRRREPSVTVMPPQGLCLEEVAYPEAAGLLARAQQTRAVRSLEPPS